MNIEPADWTAIQSLLHETYQIWSPGLSRDDYNLFIWNQVHHFWSHKNYQYLVCRDENNEVLSSCKFYSMQIACRGVNYPVAGIGAVYTPHGKRGCGYARDMLSRLTFRVKDRGYKGLFLYSDIGPEFYESLDFTALQCRDFWVHLNEVPAPASTGGAFTVRPLELSDISFLSRHYARWLRRQPYGTFRSEQYLHFKLSKELFLHHNSHWNWPRLEIVTNASGQVPGYAIIEFSGAVMRILEIIAGEDSLLAIWDELLRIAHQRKAVKLRGWEGQAPQHLPIVLAQRDWGLPMMLPLSREMQLWTEVSPFRLLELDHI